MNDTLIRTAFGLHRGGQLAEAARLYGQVLSANPDHVDALFLLASLHFQRGEIAAALARFDQVIALKPDFAEALAGRGAALSSLARHEEALAAYDKALALRPGNPQALNNRANTLLALGRNAEALAGYERTVGARPDYAEGWRNRGVALLQLGRAAEALASFERATALNPDFADAWEDRAGTLMRLLRHEEAVTSYDRALALKPGNPDLLYNRANALSIVKRYEEAIRDCEQLLKTAPDYPYARGVLIHSKLQICDWNGLDEQKAKIGAALKAGKRVVSPFNLKALSDSPEEHLRCAQAWVAHECPPAEKPLWHGARYEHDRIRIAYVSGDFNNTAVGNLMAGVFERHDRRRFDVTAVSLGPTDKTPTRLRLESAFERFMEIRGRSDAQIATALRAMEIDIAVDLMGFTGECRSAIFAQRPAPVQVQYLGFAGGMGAPYIDYLIADPIVIPQEQQRHYSEKIAYLPDSYLPHDPARGLSARRPSRADAGLPEQGVVFASFNNSYKFSQPIFDIWMRLLRAIEGSVLWLPESNVAAKRNLAREAQERGIDPSRLVFARPIPAAEDYLARLSLADLFLDTHPYNAHSTAIDALLAGVPVLTLLGNSFAGRVAASALNAAGLPELIAETPAAYEAEALALSGDSAALAALRTKLAENRTTCPLFDVDRYTRHLEAAYETMWARHQQGQAPGTFAVAHAG
jgi:predicted O-linked N-acetylglucosamine transferase (SPINDLY family)